MIAPVGFMKAAVAENVYAGNAMTRRMFYQYGLLLPRSPFGHVDQSIGKNTAAGSIGLVAPNRTIEKAFGEITIDGVQMVFQNTPGAQGHGQRDRVRLHHPARGRGLSASLTDDLGSAIGLPLNLRLSRRSWPSPRHPTGRSRFKSL